jgi:transposase
MRTKERLSLNLLDTVFFVRNVGGTLNVDRYAAYKVIAKKGLFILAFCWAHVRRDFLSHAKGYPEQEDWAMEWVARIGKLYHCNNERLRYADEMIEFKIQDPLLKQEIEAFQALWQTEQADESLPTSAKKLLVSLKNHWSGLTVFVERPEIPMDNNQAERGLRPCVLGRKNYYGSGAVWSGALAVTLYSIIETLKRWQLNPHTWLFAYFQTCARIGGRAPDNIHAFLPWNMTEEQKILLAQAPAYESSG